MNRPILEQLSKMETSSELVAQKSKKLRGPNKIDENVSTIPKIESRIDQLLEVNENHSSISSNVLNCGREYRLEKCASINHVCLILESFCFKILSLIVFFQNCNQWFLLKLMIPS